MALPENPITRRELYLARAAGQDVELPAEDITREEMYLRAIAEGGGGGGTSPFYPAGNTAFVNLPELSADILGAMYNITDAFTTDSRFNEGAGVDYPAGTNVAVVNVGTAESPVLKYDTFAGAYVVDNALSDASENPVQNKVIKSALDGKATPADIAALINDTTAAQDKTYSSAKVEEKVAGEEITTTATGSDITLSTSSGNLNALTVYGKSEVVDGSIKSAGEGWATVDLGTLTWTYESSVTRFYASLPSQTTTINRTDLICAKYKADVSPVWNTHIDKTICFYAGTNVYVNDYDYTDATTFKNSLNGVILAYQLADPTQGNAIAVKTDNGSGIDGTMAVFSTGTPLRGIPDTTVRDVMMWNGSAGTVTKNCEEADLGELNWGIASEGDNCFYTNLPNTDGYHKATIIAKYTQVDTVQQLTTIDKTYCRTSGAFIVIHDTDYTDETAFKTAMNGVMLVYELATPTTASLTSTENTSIAGLRTFAPQTHAQNNAGTEMTVEAYAGTQNGQAVNELKQDVQSEISALKITQSGTLTLTTAGWSSNQQTVTYAHDTAKRNVIDVDPASIEEWASCGVLATAETASGITFSCKTVPTNALNFKVTSMEVN